VSVLSSAAKAISPAPGRDQLALGIPKPVKIAACNIQVPAAPATNAAAGLHPPLRRNIRNGMSGIAATPLPRTSIASNARVPANAPDHTLGSELGSALKHKHRLP